jgi:hypothetical protein
VDEVVTRGRGNTPDRKGYTDCPGKGITKQLEKIQ